VKKFGSPICVWDGRPFIARSNGGRRQRFCSAHCRHRFRAALVAYGEQLLLAGKIEIADIRTALVKKSEVQ
jgi:hypothetical protein